jgi:hypothetical protein
MTAGLLELLILLSGSYVALPSGSGPDLCPHTVRVRGGSYLSVMYSGDCGDQGPFRYDCFLGGPEGGPLAVTCLDGLIEFEIRGPDRYLWRNRAYGFEGEFVRVEGP